MFKKIIRIYNFPCTCNVNVFKLMCHSSLVCTQFTKENVCDVKIIQLYFLSRNGSIINIIDAKFTTNQSSEQVASVLIDAAQNITVFDIETSSILVHGKGLIDFQYFMHLSK